MAISDLIEYCNYRWRTEHGIAEDVLVAGKRRVTARLGAIEFTSRFDAIRLTEAPALTIGHLARLRSLLVAGGGNSPAVEGNDPAQIVRFDRLCRTLHLLNYLTWRPDESGRLFLDVEARHILSVPLGHGAYFAEVIHRCGLTPAQIVLMTSSLFAACPGDYLRRLAEGMSNYRSRGYRLALAIDEFPVQPVLTDFLLYTAPDYLVLRAGSLEGGRRGGTTFLADQLGRLRRLAESFECQLLLEGVEDAETFQLAEASRIPLVQGSYPEQRRRRAVPAQTSTQSDGETRV